MLQEERYQRIIGHLQINAIVKVTDLVQMLGASSDTIRRDLEYLENQGRIKRVHGGAIYNGEGIINNSFSSREVRNKEEKTELSLYALRFVSDGAAIAINSGTTNIEFAKKLVETFSKLTIITNALRIAEILSVKEGFTVLIPGGVLNHEEMSIVGRKCEKEIGEYNIEMAFIAINAISIEKGLTDFRLDEVGIIQSMIGCAKKTFVLADYSKFDKVSIMNVLPLNRINAVITDGKAGDELVNRYERNRVNVVKARFD